MAQVQWQTNILCSQNNFSVCCNSPDNRAIQDLLVASLSSKNVLEAALRIGTFWILGGISLTCMISRT